MSVIHRAIIEFWTWAEPPRFVARVETTAAPPAPGALINILGQDYTVEAVDYSIDQPGQPFPETIYRRNVHLQEVSK